jgi:hypothetical protein
MVDPCNFEPTEPAKVHMCYDNQVGCILRETAPINDEKLKKIQNMEHPLLKKLHQRFLFPGRDEIKYTRPWQDPIMKKINRRAMGKFRGALSA